MTNDNEPLSLTLHAVNRCFICCQSKKSYSTANFSKNHWSKKLSKNIFSSLICPLKMTNDIEPLSLTLHGVNRHFIEWPPMVKMTKSAIVQTAGKIFKNKKKQPLGNIILHLCAYLWAKIPHSLCVSDRHVLVFAKLSLNSLPNGPGVRYSKF